MALGLVPAMAGIARLVQLYGGAGITAENARFFASPLPVVLHIVGSVVFSFAGALQFSVHLRRSHPGLHHALGYAVLPFGLVAALSGLWMTQIYPRATMNFDGPVLYAMRLAVGFGMMFALWRGLLAAAQCNVARHCNWMLRAYALGMGAGTQVFTHLPWFLVPAWRGETLRAICMGAGWLINLAVAEFIIARRAGDGGPTPQAQ